MLCTRCTRSQPISVDLGRSQPISAKELSEVGLLLEQRMVDELNHANAHHAAAQDVGVPAMAYGPPPQKALQYLLQPSPSTTTLLGSC